MKLYAVKNDDGLYLKFDEYGDSDWYLLPDTWSDKSKADSYANDFHGHVVELVEAPAKVVVSEEEAKMLEEAKKNGYPADVIDAYNDMRPDEDRLMHAYVLGWVVKKPKRWNVKVPHTNGDFYRKAANGEVDTTHGTLGDDNHTFTAAEIDRYDLQDCEKLECDSNDEN